MSRRRKKNNLLDSLFVIIRGLFTLAAIIIVIVLKLLIRIIKFSYDLITFFTTKYKEKSGIGFFKMFIDKGNYGEFILYRKVVRILSKESVLTNLYLDNKNTETTEIDVLAVTNKGIYVFETENYSGYIFGSEKDKHWTQILNKWTKNQFYNPLRQNYAHIKAVESYLEVDKDYIIPIVVFSNRSVLSKIDVGPQHNIFQYKDAIRFIKNNKKNSIIQITEKEKEDFLIKLLSKCNMAEEIKIKHVQDVKQLIEKNQRADRILD